MVEKELKIMGIVIAVLIVVAAVLALLGVHYGLGLDRDADDGQATSAVSAIEPSVGSFGG